MSDNKPKPVVVLVGKITPTKTEVTAIEGALRTDKPQSAWDDESIVWCQKWGGIIRHRAIRGGSHEYDFDF